MENKLSPNYSVDKVSLSMPESWDEVFSCSIFWGDVITEFKEDLGKIKFVYQEKSQELPLSLGKNIAKKLGFKVKPKTKAGEVKYEEATPQIIMKVDNEKSLVSIVTEEKEWRRLNEISNITENFSAPYVMTLPNLCYRVNIPLECITDVTFKSSEFLNKSFKEKSN